METFLIPPRWLFVRVETTAGVVGWGEPIVEGRARTVAAALEDLRPLIVGADSTRIEDLWQTLTRGGFYRGGPVLSSAIAGVDQALWDVAGRRHGVPVYELLGGAVRDRARVYGWVGGDNPAALKDHIAARLEQGLTAVKMNASGPLLPVDSLAAVAEIIARAEEAREALGMADFALDFHGRVSPAMAIRLLPELEPLRPMFVEEPVVPELLPRHVSRIVASTSIPIAAGERCYSRWDFAPLLAEGLAIAQPDVSHAGGISETRRIAVAAETAGAALAPHSPLGPLALAASLQVDFASPNFLIQEQSLGIHYNEGADLLDYLLDTSVFDIREGWIQCPTGPGLGVEIDEAAVRDAARIGHDWHAPTWRHDDGGYAEW
ncbi:galactonate dehydratase [Microbacterium sp.]|uniref:galactonate dehydratase n=1 Tax=Microbacterium sp. TaxID=51671 RepID=UPI003F704493